MCRPHRQASAPRKRTWASSPRAATRGHDLPQRLLIYAFGAALGGQRVLDGATVLAEQSGIPHDRLTLVNGEANYAHNDPAGASPDNEFLDDLLPFLKKVAR